MFNWFKVIIISIFLLGLTRSNVIAQRPVIKLGFELDNNQNFVSIPFQLINNLMVVDVLLEGVVPLKFIIDTGVTNTVLIEKSYADILNIVPDRKMELVGAAGGKGVEAYIVNQASVSLAGISGHNIPLLVLKEDYLRLEESMGIKVHGILGYDLFKNFVVRVDYSGRRIGFYRPEKFSKKLWFYERYPMSIEQTKPYLFKEVMMEDSTKVPVKLMIDTGASHSLMLHINSSSAIVLPSKTMRDVLGAGIAGEIEGHVGRIKSLTFDEETILKDVITRFPDVGTYNMIIENTERNGTIGGGILKRFSIYFDYGNQQMFLRKNRYFKEGFTYDMSGLSVIAKGELFLKPYFEIEKVRDSTPAADAGLKSNDVIIALNGIVARELDLDIINKLFTSKEGRKIKIKVRRNEEILTFEFKLRKFI